MQLQIKNGVVELSGEKILKEINFEINDTSRIAVVGRNGCGKTTLLKLIAGEHSIVKSDSDTDTFFTISGKPKIGTLSQISFNDDNIPLVLEIRSAYTEILSVKSDLESAQKEMEANQSADNIKKYTDLLDRFTNMGGFYFEKEYESAIKKFGFTDQEKLKALNEFSGGQRTKIAFLKLLLSKPDILLLDEPTNHLDIEAVAWLEDYLKNYKKAFVVVSHDRMFLDNIANTVYEIEYGKTRKYVGNYSQFTIAKKQLREQQQKDYNAQKKEIEHLEGLVERFRYKATKASMAQSKIKQLEKMEIIDAPEKADIRTFKAKFIPEDMGVTDVLSVNNLKIGYNTCLSTVSLEVKRGDRIGIIGGNGLGKSTFIKTIMGQISALGGEYRFGPRVNIGYFDQQMAQYKSFDTVLDDFRKSYPELNDFESRSVLGTFMFSSEDVFKTVDMLSGGERVRLALCKIFMKKPNFLILDEPTNHMDIVGKETLEEMLLEFPGTIIFVSHDRYFIKKIAHSILSFENDGVKLYPYGFEHYLESLNSDNFKEELKQPKEKTKKTYTTPGKERSKKERQLKKAEENINLLEEKLYALKNELESEENLTDYQKLSQLQSEIETTENELEIIMNDWAIMSEELENLP